MIMMMRKKIKLNDKNLRISLIIGLSATLIAPCINNKVLPPQFRAQVIDNEIQIGYGLAIGDVDGDGKDDILLADKKQFVWYRNGDWKRFVMVDDLTDRDNVCLAARDINGDGQVEVAVGAQWNPGETSNSDQSGSVHYLIRPKDPTQLWKAVKLHHEPTVHRMKWVKTANSYQLIVLPLHGRGNKDGQGESVRVVAYNVPDNPMDPWVHHVLDQSMHLTHNFDLVDDGESEALLVGGKEGAKKISYQNGTWSGVNVDDWLIGDLGFGEIRTSKGLIAGIQPLHGNELTIYNKDGTRILLTDSLKQGHALALADLLSQGQDQIVVGWRNENDAGEVGIKLFIADNAQWGSWHSIWIDKNQMACEDLKVADLNGDGRKDIIAAGRGTHNLKVYWNQSK